MKAVVYIFSFLLAVFVFIMFSGDGETYERTQKQLELEKRFQGPDEKMAKDALWTSSYMFKVSVIDDGSSKNGYAEYVCQVLNGEGMLGKRVQIIDAVKLNRDGEWVTLGERAC